MNLIHCHFITHLLRVFPFSRDLVRAVQANSEAPEWPQLQLCPQRLGPPTYTLSHHRQKKCFELRKEQSSTVIFQRQQRSLRTHQVVLPRQILVAVSSGIRVFPTTPLSQTPDHQQL